MEWESNLIAIIGEEPFALKMLPHYKQSLNKSLSILEKEAEGKATSYSTRSKINF
jgi:hypothetical protein